MRCLGSEKWLEMSADLYSDAEGVLSARPQIREFIEALVPSACVFGWLGVDFTGWLDTKRPTTPLICAIEFSRERSPRARGLLRYGAHFLYKSRRLPPSNANS
jgi:hypothetical protein